ncbi:DegQ family serine endoprotease [Lentisalinibacter sediminis]|uniref:DegQ family serine endoprotease n=1 Tax=Lentisalinibacter sediminis TaxID=2992237 RepID=UPI00386A4FAF
MTRRSVLATLILAIGLAGPGWAALPQLVDDEKVPSLAPLVQRVSPAVVNIRVSATVEMRTPFHDNDPFRRFFGLPDQQPRERQMQSAGSGVIVDADNGYIITNHHVVDGADGIEITLFNDRTLDAEIIGSDPGTDIAILKVEEDGLVELPIGDSDVLEVGDFVIAIGNPFGLQHTVTSGIVSALGRFGLNPDGYEDFIQTDASINPGNSGGALVNLRGELVGINSAIISRSGGNVGIGFAVPSNMANAIMRQILEYGEVRRGLLGVQISTVDEDTADALGLDDVRGALVQSVNPGSAAEQAGIQVDDIIVEANGEPIASGTELRNTIGLLRAGDEVEIRLLRDGRERTVTAVLDDRNAMMSSAGVDLHPGLEGAEFTPATGPDADGVEVVSVEAGSPAAQRGLRPGDIIVEVNRSPVTNMTELREAAGDSRILFLKVIRGERVLLLQIR